MQQKTIFISYVHVRSYSACVGPRKETFVDILAILNVTDALSTASCLCGTRITMQTSYLLKTPNALQTNCCYSGPDLTHLYLYLLYFSLLDLRYFIQHDPCIPAT